MMDACFYHKCTDLQELCFPFQLFRLITFDCVNHPVAGNKGMGLVKLGPAAKPGQNFVSLEQRGLIRDHFSIRRMLIRPKIFDKSVFLGIEMDVLHNTLQSHSPLGLSAAEPLLEEAPGSVVRLVDGLRC